ncbi:right-handed parallel beta-helix repeat-containing protein [Paenibacillus silvisoli]|uniref:right-handed parallel beta-helix repeat-containing protein n=1 Tax=Paenibacillus silvisoli TaxID=3110539 RepID=UPI00280559A7|nr:right-handed parallel beta-helix repeat-containing protein [Paenibacillus silvisoli]
MNYYVAVHGSDSNPGTEQEPFASLTKARDCVRSINGLMTEDIVVYIRGGIYYLDREFALDDRDSGSNGFNVQYRNYPGETPILYGGHRITNWEHIKFGVYKAKVDRNWAFQSLIEHDEWGIRYASAALTGPGQWYLDEQAGELVYWPRSSDFSMANIAAPIIKDMFRLVGSSPSAPVRNIQIIGLQLQLTDTVKHFDYVDSIDFVNGNAEREETKHGLIYMENAESITVKNCRLMNAGVCGVWLNKHAQHNEIYGNWIEGSGLNGVYLTGWSFDQGPFTSAEDAYVNKFNRVSNNFIYDSGKFELTRGSGIQLHQSGDNEISHNRIMKAPRYGISMKGDRYGVLENHGSIYGIPVTRDNRYDFLYTRNNRIMFNDVSNVMMNSEDGAGIESWGAGTGNVYDHNCVHDFVNLNHWRNWFGGIYLDDCSDYMTVTNNIVYGIHGGHAFGIMEKGIENRVFNNIIANNGLTWAIWMQEFAEVSYGLKLGCNILFNNSTTAIYGFEHLREGFAGNPVYTSVYEGELPERIASFDHNLIYEPVGSTDVLMGDKNTVYLSYENWKAAYGYDVHTIQGKDPLFVDAENGDFRLHPDSPALALGFTPIDQSLIGLKSDFPWEPKQTTPVSVLIEANGIRTLPRLHQAAKEVTL